MDYTKLINPKTGELVHLFNKDGKKLLKRYINHYKSGGGDVVNINLRRGDFQQILDLASQDIDNTEKMVDIFKKKLWFSTIDDKDSEQEQEQEQQAQSQEQQLRQEQEQEQLRQEQAQEQEQVNKLVDEYLSGSTNLKLEALKNKVHYIDQSIDLSFLDNTNA